MTSEKVGDWNFEKRTYKTHDPFCEPDLISILFLSCGKHELTKACLNATIKSLKDYPGKLEWIFLEQGGDDKNYDLFNDADVKRKVVIRQDNYGINNGFNQMWAISRGEYCFVLESDWMIETDSHDFLSRAKSIFEQYEDIGIVQFRAVFDPNENWGIFKPEYNPWSCPDEALKNGFPIKSEKLKCGYEFVSCTFPNAFNNNPNLIRKSLWGECGVYPEPPMDSDPRHGETVYQRRVEATGISCAHIGGHVYVHAGGAARRRYEG